MRSIKEFLYIVLQEAKGKQLQTLRRSLNVKVGRTLDIIMLSRQMGLLRNC